MPETRYEFGVVGPAGNQIRWAGILKNDNLAPGDATDFFVEVHRPAASGALPPPGANVGVVKFPPGGTVTIDPPGPNFALGNIDTLNAGQTKSVEFHIANDPSGVNPANYWLVCFLLYSGGFFVSPVIAV